MAIALTKELLQALCPRPKTGAKAIIWDGYVNALTSEQAAELLTKYGITTKLRLAHLLAQWAHECSSFTIIWESGAYSAKRISQIFGVGKHSAAITPSEAARLAGNGYALFERVYGLGNPRKARELGNRAAGDGFNFRGCSITQLTGRWAHQTYADKIGCKINEIEVPINGIHGALLEWEEKGCNAPADKDDIVSVTKKVNGGRNGLADRRNYLAKARKLLDALPEEKKKPKLVTPPRPPEEVRLGDEPSANVRELQELLVRAGYVVPVDGQIGPRTEAALAGFQVNHGLPATGIGDMETWEALRAVKPVERQVDVKVLAEKSRIVSLGLSLQNWFSWGYRGAVTGVMSFAGYVGFGEETNPLEVVDKASATAEKANDLATKLNLPVGLTDWRVWAFIILAVIGIVCLFGRRKSQGIVAARVEDAQTGANLSA